MKGIFFFGLGAVFTYIVLNIYWKRNLHIDLDLESVATPNHYVSGEQISFKYKVVNHGNDIVPKGLYGIKTFVNGELYDRYIGHHDLLSKKNFEYSLPYTANTKVDEINWKVEVFVSDRLVDITDKNNILSGVINTK